MEYRAKHAPSTQWWPSLSRTDPHPFRFWHRESPRVLVPENHESDPTIRANDPPMEVSGMVTIAMDARGNLERLWAVPPQVETPGATAVTPDWKPLFAAAGLDFARFTPSGAKWVPDEPFDARADWEGVSVSQPDLPIHVAAASWQGRPVWFAVLYPWSVPERETETPLLNNLSAVAIVLYIGGAWIAGIVLARRNLRLGRGDRRGALRVASFVFATGILAWFFMWHHVPQLATEFFQLILAVERSLFFAVFVWLGYIGIEPILRRRSPELLFSWSRVLAGKFRDPLVGRDLLAGLLGVAAMGLLGQIALALPNWIPISGITPQPPSPSMLLGTARTIGRVLDALSRGPLDGLGFMTLFAFGLVVLRRRWLAAALIGIQAMLLFAGDFGEAPALLAPLAILTAGVFVLVATRTGVLAVTVILAIGPLLVTTPFTFELSRWYAGRALVILVAILALAVWAFWISLGGRRALGFVKLEEA
jgi:hypothetical protein